MSIIKKFLPGANPESARGRKDVLRNLFPQTAAVPQPQVNQGNLFAGGDQQEFIPHNQPHALGTVPMDESAVDASSMVNTQRQQTEEPTGFSISNNPYAKQIRELDGPADVNKPDLVIRKTKHVYSAEELRDLGLDKNA